MDLIFLIVKTLHFDWSCFVQLNCSCYINIWYEIFFLCMFQCAVAFFSPGNCYVFILFYFCCEELIMLLQVNIWVIAHCRLEVKLLKEKCHSLLKYYLREREREATDLFYYTSVICRSICLVGQPLRIWCSENKKLWRYIKYFN